MIERMLSETQAAKRCGISTTTFRRLVDSNIVPQPVSHPDVERNLWDVKVLDRYLDKISGIMDGKSDAKMKALERMKANAQQHPIRS